MVFLFAIEWSKSIDSIISDIKVHSIKARATTIRWLQSDMPYFVNLKFAVWFH
jgi:hypothetical protein